MLGERSRWPEALRLLRSLRTEAQRPKLGAYQRWVRELNVAQGDQEELLMLDAVMRLAAGLPCGEGAVGRLEVTKPWAPELPPEPVEKEALAEEAGGSVAKQLLKLISARKAAPGMWRVLAHEKAADRMPPNHYDLEG